MSLSDYMPARTMQTSKASNVTMQGNDTFYNMIQELVLSNGTVTSTCVTDGFENSSHQHIQ